MCDMQQLEERGGRLGLRGCKSVRLDGCWHPAGHCGQLVGPAWLLRLLPHMAGHTPKCIRLLLPSAVAYLACCTPGQGRGSQGRWRYHHTP